MALLDKSLQQLHCKIVYYGPGASGKTTNLQYIHWQLPAEDRSEVRSISTETERTLLFDFRLPDLASIRGFQVRFHIYTIPGCVLSDQSRYKILAGVDGVVFVADSQKVKLSENIRILHELAVGMRVQNRSLHDLPVVIQYNKRDVPDVLSVERLDRHLNTRQWPRFEAVGVEGGGVIETLRAICDRVYTQVSPDSRNRPIRH